MARSTPYLSIRVNLSIMKASMTYSSKFHLGQRLDRLDLTWSYDPPFPLYFLGFVHGGHCQQE